MSPPTVYRVASDNDQRGRFVPMQAGKYSRVNARIFAAKTGQEVPAFH